MKNMSIAALVCGMLVGATAQATLVRTDSAEIRGTFQYDFDAGAEVFLNGADVHWRQNNPTSRDLTVALSSTAGLLSLGSVDFDAITESQLMAYVYGTPVIAGPPDPNSPLQIGDVFAVLTDQGNYVKGMVTGYDNGLPDRPYYDLHIAYALYDGLPQTPVAQVPEPGAFGLVALGIGALGWTRRRKAVSPSA